MSHKLLLADDSVTIQRVIELTFADEDVQVAVVGDGKQAIDRIQADRPDIVLADIGMPERDGYEVAAFVKGTPQLAHIPVVLLTGAFEPIDEHRARSVGCDGVLVKPFEPQMVINRVRELLSGQRPLNRAAAPPPSPSHVPHEIDSDLAPPTSFDHQKSDGDSLEDYFDRLDAAFANIAPPAPKEPQEPENLGAALVDLHEAPPERAPAAPDPLTAWDPETVREFGPARQPHLASAFAALLAAEEGNAAPELAMIALPAELPEEAIEDIVRRVLLRMGDESMRRLVVETAERVVREEIDRIKRG
jgi:CheY-like chemotaxis protein